MKFEHFPKSSKEETEEVTKIEKSPKEEDGTEITPPEIIEPKTIKTIGEDFDTTFLRREEAAEEVTQELVTKVQKRYGDLFEEAETIIEGEELEESELEEITEEEASELEKTKVFEKQKEDTAAGKILEILKGKNLGERLSEGERLVVFEKIYRLLKEGSEKDLIRAYEKANLVLIEDEAEIARRKEKLSRDILRIVGDYNMVEIIKYLGLENDIIME